MREAAAERAAPADEAIGRGILPRLLGYHLRRAQVALFDHFRRTPGLEEITPGLFGMLQVIAANPGMSQSRLAEAMGVDRSTIVAVVDKLERRGLVARRKSPTDRRSHCLDLTPGGRGELTRLEAAVLGHEADFTAVLTADERIRLIGLLTKLHGRESRPEEEGR